MDTIAVPPHKRVVGVPFLRIRTNGIMMDTTTDATFDGVCIRAAAWTAKYCDKDDHGKPLLQDIPILCSCVHPGIRGMVYPKGEKCKYMLRHFGNDGYQHAIGHLRHGYGRQHDTGGSGASNYKPPAIGSI